MTSLISLQEMLNITHIKGIKTNLITSDSITNVYADATANAIANAGADVDIDADFSFETLHGAADRFKAYSIIQPGQKSYLIFGDNIKEHPKDTSELQNYTVTFKNPHGLDTSLPKFTDCIFFLKEENNSISRDFTPNDSSFTYTPKVPKELNINHGVHLIQCEFIAPSQGNALIEVRATYTGSKTDITFPQYFWTEEEEASKTPLDPSKKTPFSDHIIVKYDDYDNSKNKKNVKVTHSIEILNLKNDYSFDSDKKEFYIRLSGANFAYRTQDNDIECNVKEIINGKEEVHIRPASIIDIKSNLGDWNPYFKFHTGDGIHNHKYTAGSILKIQCPSIILYKSNVINGPDQHIITAVRGDTYLGGNYIDENHTSSMTCYTYPCSLFLTQNEREEDIIDKGSNTLEYVFLGVILVLLLLYLIVSCFEKKGPEYEAVN